MLRYLHGLQMNAIAFWARHYRADGEKLRAALVRDATEKEPGARKSFEVFETFDEKHVTEAVVNTRWALTWKMLDGKKCVGARPAAKGN